MPDYSKESTPADGSESDDPSEGEEKEGQALEEERGPNLSAYEIQRAKNIAENKARLDEVDARLRAKFNLEPVTPKPKPTKPRKRKQDNQATASEAVRRSTRQPT